MNDNKKEIILRLPKNIYEILLRYKNQSGVSITNQIYEALFRQLVGRNLINLADIRGKPNIKNKIPTQIIPKEILYCDSTSCDNPNIKLKKVNK